MSSDAVWFGGNGVVRYEKGGSVVRHGRGPAQQRGPRHLRLADRTWVGTYGGGLQSIERDGRIVSWGEREGLTNAICDLAAPRPEDTLWIGTYGGGCSGCSDGKMYSITTRDGLPDDVVFDVIEDDAGRLWLTGTQGLAVVRLADVHARMDGRGGVLSVAQYGRAEGVPGTDGTDGNQPLSWLAKDGRLWFATVDGVVIFDPTEVADTPTAPAVSIDTVQVNKAAGRSVGAGQRPRGTQHRHRLQRAAADGGTRRAVRVPPRRARRRAGSMPARHARRRSRTCHPVITTSRCVHAPAAARHPGTVRTLSFRVPARYYQTGWFLGLSITALPLVIAGLVRWRVGRLRRHQQDLQRLVEERTAALRHEMVERNAPSVNGGCSTNASSRRSASKASACWPAASRTTSTTCSWACSARPASRSPICRRVRRTPARRANRARGLRASELTSQMLAYSGRGRFIVVPVSLEDLVEEVHELLGSIIPRDHHRLPRFPRGCRWSRAIRRSCGRS